MVAEFNSRTCCVAWTAEGKPVNPFEYMSGADKYAGVAAKKLLAGRPQVSLDAGTAYIVHDQNHYPFCHTAGSLDASADDTCPMRG